MKYFWYYNTNKHITRYKEGVADGVLGRRLCSTNTDYGIGHQQGEEIRADKYKAEEGLRAAEARLVHMRACANKVRRTVAENL